MRSGLKKTRKKGEKMENEKELGQCQCGCCHCENEATETDDNGIHVCEECAHCYYDGDGNGVCLRCECTMAELIKIAESEEQAHGQMSQAVQDAIRMQKI